MSTTTNNQVINKTMSFYKENSLWYADLPQFLEAGLGVKANLLMVDGADRFLDFLSNNGHLATIQLSTEPFEGAEAVLHKINIGLNRSILEAVGHAPVDYGAYYHVKTYREQVLNHQLWLCPVTEYVFEGGYPDEIYIKVIA